ncbi:hypothetical protein EDD17DRAFT_871331 [Pisolithus thermaeus]|nr:hypothetical protein EDD17DRAFT_871331 [Pisolithus thermaeus]
MDSHVTILGANGAGQSTLLTSSQVPYDHEEKISKHAALRLARCLHHSADQLPCDKSPIEHFQSIFHERHSEEDVQLGRLGPSGSRQTSPIKERLEGQRNRWERDLAN